MEEINLPTTQDTNECIPSGVAHEIMKDTDMVHHETRETV